MKQIFFITFSRRHIRLPNISELGSVIRPLLELINTSQVWATDDWALHSSLCLKQIGGHREKVTQPSMYECYYTRQKRPDVSSPIRSVKIYSYAQCTMQKRSVCCRDVPCLAHMDQGPGPSTLSTHPPSTRVLGTQYTSSLQQGWTWTVEWTLASSPTQNLWSRKIYVDIVFISI